MSADEQLPTATSNVGTAATVAATDAIVVDQERSEKILKAKELYSHGSRNFLVKSYSEAADELSQVCALYEELYGELSDELGMPYLLYAKSLIALALDENKVIDVPDEEEIEDDDDDDEDNDDEAEVGEAEDKVETSTNGDTVKGATITSTNGSSTSQAKDTLKDKAGIEKTDEADSTADGGGDDGGDTPAEAKIKSPEKTNEEAQVSSTNDNAEKLKNGTENGTAGTGAAATTTAEASSAATAIPVLDGEKPSTSNGETENVEDDEEENEAASSLQLAWEILELAAKIFTRQGTNGLPNLAEVKTELANIEFENNIPEAAREDYEKALKIYSELPTNYRRAMAEIHYKIGLTFLMQQLNKEGAESLKSACALIDEEIDEIKEKEELTEKDKNNIQDMEETKQEIWAKIAEIEETQAQNIAEVRAALDSYIKPMPSENADGAGPSSSSSSTGAAASSSISSSTKPTDISHLIKRKKPEEPSSEAEAASPAKRPAV